MIKLNDKSKKEQKIIALMIKLYCRKKHHSKELCENCSELLNYANLRIEKCPFMETKTFCSACKVHCYKKEMREKIREVMKFSGPRMIFYHPILAIKHLTQTIKEN